MKISERILEGTVTDERKHALLQAAAIILALDNLRYYEPDGDMRPYGEFNVGAEEESHFNDYEVAVNHAMSLMEIIDRRANHG